MLDLDGSAGGGQLLRTALALSALAGEPFRMTGVRAERESPGLRPQHCAAVRVLGDVTDADVEGASEGSTELTFDPGRPRPGRYEVDVGTAGSLPLLFDAVLPLALDTPGPLSVTATGGTDVKWSPTTAHYRSVKLPLLGAAGLWGTLEVARPGFYPAGGGRATLSVAPSAPEPLELVERGDFEGARVYSTAATALDDAAVARRQAAAAAERLAAAGLDVYERVVRTADADSPGSAVCVRLDYGETRAGFDALGERGRPAEDVGETAADAAIDFENGVGAVDRHLADQLIVPLALAGGRVRIPAVTDHVETCVALLGEFGFEVALEGRPEGALLSA
jgi:RNA 3'-terminal phosphate cyclase (ATP)